VITHFHPHNYFPTNAYKINSRQTCGSSPPLYFPHPTKLPLSSASSPTPKSPRRSHAGFRAQYLLLNPITMATPPPLYFTLPPAYNQTDPYPAPLQPAKTHRLCPRHDQCFIISAIIGGGAVLGTLFFVTMYILCQRSTVEEYGNLGWV
jgi:hypothetical protein